MNHEGDDSHNGELLSLIFKPMVAATLGKGFEYLIEGVQLVPKHVSELQAEFEGNIRSYYIGFADVDVISKLH